MNAVNSAVVVDASYAPEILIFRFTRWPSFDVAAAAVGSEVAAVDKEISRLTEAIAVGGELTSLLAALTSRQARRDELLASRALVVEHRPFDRRGIETCVRERLADWRGLLTDKVADGRELLRQVLDGPMKLTPENGVYRIEGQAAIGRLLATAGVPPYMASPTGFEPVF